MVLIVLFCARLKGIIFLIAILLWKLQQKQRAKNKTKQQQPSPPPKKKPKQATLLEHKMHWIKMVLTATLNESDVYDYFEAVYFRQLEKNIGWSDKN